jgi:hypothetical protein
VPPPPESWLAAQIHERLVTTGRFAEEDALPIARTVLAYFAGRDEVVDAKLCSTDRGRFYALEEAGILRVQTEEVSLGKGRRWRVHYWSFEGRPTGS